PDTVKMGYRGNSGLLKGDSADLGHRFAIQFGILGKRCPGPQGPATVPFKLEIALNASRPFGVTLARPELERYRIFVDIADLIPQLRHRHARHLLGRGGPACARVWFTASQVNQIRR